MIASDCECAALLLLSRWFFSVGAYLCNFVHTTHINHILVVCQRVSVHSMHICTLSGSIVQPVVLPTTRSDALFPCTCWCVLHLLGLFAVARFTWYAGGLT